MHMVTIDLRKMGKAVHGNALVILRQVLGEFAGHYDIEVSEFVSGAVKVQSFRIRPEVALFEVR
jgi:hypothetical protein